MQGTTFSHMRKVRADNLAIHERMVAYARDQEASLQDAHTDMPVQLCAAARTTNMIQRIFEVGATDGKGSEGWRGGSATDAELVDLVQEIATDGDGSVGWCGGSTSDVALSHADLIKFTQEIQQQGWATMAGRLG